MRSKGGLPLPEDPPQDRIGETDRPLAARDAHPLDDGVDDGMVRGRGEQQFVQADAHQVEEDRFAANAADLLKRRALAHDYESLIVVAPPRTLGELRKHYHKEVSDRIIGELDKDLTGHPISDIEKALIAA